MRLAELEKKKKELAEEMNFLRLQIQKLVLEKKRKEEAGLFFDKHFRPDIISDEHNFYPHEYFFEFKKRFIETFIDDEGFNKSTILDLEKEYVAVLSEKAEEIYSAVENMKERYFSEVERDDKNG